MIEALDIIINLSTSILLSKNVGLCDLDTIDISTIVTILRQRSLSAHTRNGCVQKTMDSPTA